VSYAGALASGAASALLRPLYLHQRTFWCNNGMQEHPRGSISATSAQAGRVAMR